MAIELVGRAEEGGYASTSTTASVPTLRLWPVNALQTWSMLLWNAGPSTYIVVLTAVNIPPEANASVALRLLAVNKARILRRCTSLLGTLIIQTWKLCSLNSTSTLSVQLGEKTLWTRPTLISRVATGLSHYHTSASPTTCPCCYSQHTLPSGNVLPPQLRLLKCYNLAWGHLSTAPGLLWENKLGHLWTAVPGGLHFIRAEFYRVLYRYCYHQEAHLGLSESKALDDWRGQDPAEGERCGDGAQYSTARASLRRGIIEAKTAYQRRIEEHLSSNNTRQVWQGVQHTPATNPKTTQWLTEIPHWRRNWTSSLLASRQSNRMQPHHTPQPVTTSSCWRIMRCGAHQRGWTRGKLQDQMAYLELYWRTVQTSWLLSLPG